MSKAETNKTKEKSPSLTREEFFKILTKTTTSVPKSSKKEKSKTSESRPSDDYNEKRTH